MPDDTLPAKVIDALNAVLTEDQLRSFALRWRAADPERRRLMEAEALMKGSAFARLAPDRFPERRQVKESFEREGLEDGNPT